MANNGSLQHNEEMSTAQKDNPELRADEIHDEHMDDQENETSQNNENLTETARKNAQGTKETPPPRPMSTDSEHNSLAGQRVARHSENREQIPPVEAKEMRKSARLSQKQTKPDNDTQIEPNAQKKRSDNRISKIAVLDNGTMVESFKFLNYCHLAANSLVSKRFRKVIRTHRRFLAFLNVDQIIMARYASGPVYIKMFDKVLSAEEYNEWVIRYEYSKQISFEGQVAGMQSTQNKYKFYELWANANYKDSSPSNGINSTLYACAELNNENWPLFQHFARLLTDPFVCIRRVELVPQNDFLNLLASVINSDHNRMQCEELVVDLRDIMQELICLIKDHVLCDKFRISRSNDSNYDKEFLDFFMTGANCTSEICAGNYDISNVVVDFVQKFIDLKSCDENQLIEFIWGNRFSRAVVEALKRDYAEFIVKDQNTECVFEFVNNDIGKKLQLITISSFSLKIAYL